MCERAPAKNAGDRVVAAPRFFSMALGISPRRNSARSFAPAAVYEAPERNVGIGKSGRVRRGVAEAGLRKLVLPGSVWVTSLRAWSMVDRSPFPATLSARTGGRTTR